MQELCLAPGAIPESLGKHHTTAHHLTAPTRSRMMWKNKEVVE